MLMQTCFPLVTKLITNFKWKLGWFIGDETDFFPLRIVRSFKCKYCLWLWHKCGSTMTIPKRQFKPTVIAPMGNTGVHYLTQRTDPELLTHFVWLRLAEKGVEVVAVLWISSRNEAFQVKTNVDSTQCKNKKATQSNSGKRIVWAAFRAADIIIDNVIACFFMFHWLQPSDTFPVYNSATIACCCCINQPKHERCLCYCRSRQRIHCK